MAFPLSINDPIVRVENKVICQRELLPYFFDTLKICYDTFPESSRHVITLAISFDQGGVQTEMTSWPLLADVRRSSDSHLYRRLNVPEQEAVETLGDHLLYHYLNACSYFYPTLIEGFGVDVIRVTFNLHRNTMSYVFFIKRPKLKVANLNGGLF